MFHDEHYGETGDALPLAKPSVVEQFPGATHGWGLSEYEVGLLLGILIGEGHFGGDRKQPQITLRMHVRHYPLLEYLRSRCPGSSLYGPYHHDGRDYYQLMWRGAWLRDGLIPLLDRLPWESIDPHTFDRFSKMKERYGLG